jgi:hypothetical protein
MLTYADVCTCSGGFRNGESCYADEDCQALKYPKRQH